MKTRPLSLLAGKLIVALLLASLGLLSTGCQVVKGKDGRERKVIAPLKLVPDGNYAKLHANTSSPFTGSTTATAGEAGLEVEDGQATAGGYTVTKTTPWGISATFTVELAEERDALEVVAED